MSYRWILLLALLGLGYLVEAKPWDRPGEDAEEEGPMKRMYRQYIDPSNPDSILGKVGKFFTGVYNFFKRRFGAADEPEVPVEREMPPFQDERPRPPERRPPAITTTTTRRVVVTSPTTTTRRAVVTSPSTTSTTTEELTTTSTITETATSTSSQTAFPTTQEPQTTYQPEEPVTDRSPNSSPPQEEFVPRTESTINIDQAGPSEPSLEVSTRQREETTQNVPSTDSSGAPDADSTTRNIESLDPQVVNDDQPIIHTLEEDDDYNSIPYEGTVYHRVRDKK